MSKYRKSFPTLQNAASKLYLSSVVSPLAAIEAQSDVQRIDGAQAIATGIPTASYVLIALTNVAGDSPAERFARHDAEIAAIVEKASADTLFVYTARHSAPVEVKSRQIRQTSPEVADVTRAYIDLHLMIYYTNLTYDGQQVQIDSLSVSRQNDTHLSATLQGPKPFTFDVVTDGINWWALSNLVFDSAPQYPLELEIGALPNFSYHCGPALEFRTLKGARSLLQWSGLQVEPNFAGEQARSNFSEPWDCVGFVSPGMLGGFFVVLLMLAIVTVGLAWIMDIRTMDRFDDPKGKAIVVAATE